MVTDISGVFLKAIMKTKVREMKFFFIPVLIFFFISNPLFSQNFSHNWKRMSGIWKVENSVAYETQGKAVVWDYYELLNLNSVLSLNSYKSYDSINLIVNVHDRVQSPAELIISFAVTSESQSWYYHMYAFKLTGGYWGINKAALIYSDRKDKSKPFNTKNNTFIRELASASCKVKYGVPYNYRVEFVGSDVILFINGEKILSAPFPEKTHDGRIAISSRNVKIAVDKVEVKQGEKTVFVDDFNENSIYVKVLKAERVPSNNQKKENTKQK